MLKSIFLLLKAKMAQLIRNSDADLPADNSPSIFLCETGGNVLSPALFVDTLTLISDQAAL